MKLEIRKKPQAERDIEECLVFIGKTYSVPGYAKVFFLSPTATDIIAWGEAKNERNPTRI